MYFLVQQTSMLQDKIKSLASAYKEEVISFRRHLHAHPELSFKEFETATFVANKLKEFWITEIESKATTGWSALIKGKNPEKRVVALRADMDALPIIETNEVPYKSQNPGGDACLWARCAHRILVGSSKNLE